MYKTILKYKSYYCNLLLKEAANMKLAPAELHNLNQLKMKRCHTLTNNALYKNNAKVNDIKSI